MTRVDVERRVREIRWPEASADLRARVLSAAPIVERSVTWSDRVWFSRAWRIAAAAVVIGAIAIDSFSQTPGVIREVPTSQAVGEAQVIEEAAREVGLPADVAESLARRTLMTATHPAADLQTSVAQALETGAH